jgi:hypothetical protein
MVCQDSCAVSRMEIGKSVRSQVYGMSPQLRSAFAGGRALRSPRITDSSVPNLKSAMVANRRAAQDATNFGGRTLEHFLADCTA